MDSTGLLVDPRRCIAARRTHNSFEVTSTTFQIRCTNLRLVSYEPFRFSFSRPTSSEESSPRDSHLLATIIQPKRCADSLSNCQESLQEPIILFPTPRHLNRNLPSLRSSLFPPVVRSISGSRQINLILPPRRVRSSSSLPSSSPPPLS